MTDIFIDYLNGIERMKEILDASHYRVYYSAVSRKKLRKESIPTYAA